MTDEETQVEPGQEPEPDDETEREDDDATEDATEGDDAVESEQAPAAQDLSPTPRQLRAIETAHTNHEKRLREIMGEAFDLFKVCPTCEGASIVPAELAVVDELNPLPGAIACPGCNAQGRLRTPSKVPGQETQVCVDCAGLGWKREQAAMVAPVAGGAYPPPAVPNGQPQAPPGYILVQVDPNAAPIPNAPPVQPAPVGVQT